MRISVIVPALNEARGIAVVLEALAPLRSAGHEVLVVDGGSVDGTPDAALPLADRVLSAARGRAAQMNAGAAAATGEVFWFLHADTRPEEAALAALVDALDRGARWGRFNVRIEGQSPWLRVIAWFMNRRSCLTSIATGDQGIFVRRHLFVAVGGFPAIPLMEDIAISRLLKRHASAACIRQCLVTSGRRWERHGVWRTILLMWRLRLAYHFGADPARLAARYR